MRLKGSNKEVAVRVKFNFNILFNSNRVDRFLKERIHNLMG